MSDNKPEQQPSGTFLSEFERLQDSDSEQPAEDSSTFYHTLSKTKLLQGCKTWDSSDSRVIQTRLESIACVLRPPNSVWWSEASRWLIMKQKSAQTTKPETSQRIPKKRSEKQWSKAKYWDGLLVMVVLAPVASLSALLMWFDVCWKV